MSEFSKSQKSMFISPKVNQTLDEIGIEDRQFQKMNMLGTLMCGMAHDFNNILTAILSYAELAKCPEPQDSFASLQGITKAAIRGRDLVQQVLAFGSQQEQNLQPTNLATVTAEVLQLLRVALPSTIKIDQEQATLPSFVLGDSIQIFQIVMNLCLNAADSMRTKGGVMEISLSHVNMERGHMKDYPDLTPGPFVRLKIRDTGSGISPHIFAQIFNPFFTTKKKPEEGTGMGLAVVLDVATRLQGMISVDSVPGGGTTFDIYLPKFSAPAETKEASEESPTMGNECILFIDNEDSICRLVQETLKHFNYTVITQTSSHEALEMFLEAPDQFDLVITDLSMPNLSGEEFINNIRRCKPDIPIILCTGLDKELADEQARKLAVQTSLLKPFTPHSLATTIRQELDRAG